MLWSIEKFDDDGELLNVVFRRGELWIEFLGSAKFEGRKVYFVELHVQGSGANSLGTSLLKELVNVVKALIDVDAIHIEGAFRTTGANPNRKPRPLIF